MLTGPEKVPSGGAWASGMKLTSSERNDWCEEMWRCTRVFKLSILYIPLIIITSDIHLTGYRDITLDAVCLMVAAPCDVKTPLNPIICAWVFRRPWLTHKRTIIDFWGCVVLSCDQDTIHAEKGCAAMHDFCMAPLMFLQVMGWNQEPMPIQKSHMLQAECFPAPDDEPLWEMYNFCMGMGSCYILCGRSCLH